MQSIQKARSVIGARCWQTEAWARRWQCFMGSSHSMAGFGSPLPAPWRLSTPIPGLPKLAFSALFDPRLITNGRKVESGTSGGVTPLGYLAALCGSALIAVIAALFHPLGKSPDPGRHHHPGWHRRRYVRFPAGRYRASHLFLPHLPEGDRAPPHAHLRQPRPSRARGWRWLQNDWVNFLCSLTGALLAAGLYYRLLQ